MEPQIITTLIFAGMVSGIINFFTIYINLPFTPPKSLEDNPPVTLKDIWWIALLGYLIVGIAGAMLVPLLNVMASLKGLDWLKDPLMAGPVNLLVLFGYGLVLGYSTTRVLVSLLDVLMKKVSSLELSLSKLTKHTEFQLHQKSNDLVDQIIQTCESEFDAHKDDCSGFVKAVAGSFGINLTGQADDIVNQLKGPGWTNLKLNGVAAKEKADKGWLVIAALASQDNVPPENNGHVAVIVSGPLDYDKYPTGYWGKLGGSGKKFTTINYAWNKESRDKVSYAAQQIG